MRPELIDGGWNHASVMPEADSRLGREDACGGWMRRDCFGRRANKFDWKIEKVSIGETNTAENLRLFKVRNSYDLANGRPHWHTTVNPSNVPTKEYARPPRSWPV